MAKKIKYTDINIIRRIHPSICYDCMNARHQANDENIISGFVGCIIRAREDLKFIDEDKISAEIIAEGWIRRSHIRSKEKSGHLLNYQLITKGTYNCYLFSEEILFKQIIKKDIRKLFNK